MKAGNESREYYHLAAVADDEAAKALQRRDFFKRYSEQMKQASVGILEVLLLAIIAETSARP
jgi:hypothetical protein